MTRIRCERGQATVLAAVLMVAMLGMAGFVVDVGSWFRQQRTTQTTVDAAALAGAQALPTDPTQAKSLAADFASKNGGVAGTQVTVSSLYRPNDLISVTQSKGATGFFSKLFGVTTVTVGSKASAITEPPEQVMGAAPIGVDLHHKMLSGPGCPCFNQPTTIDLGKVGVPGGFMIIDLDRTSGGTTGASTVADWIQAGYNAWLPLGDYPSDTGAKWNNGQIQNAIQTKYGKDLLFPVYDKVQGGGSGAQYEIVGWASFHVTNTTAGGSSGQITGWFDRVIWKGIVSAKGPKSDQPDLGVYSVALID